MIATNQTPEQLVRDEIDKMLEASGWKVQSKKQINLAAGVGVTFLPVTVFVFNKKVNKNFQDWICKKQAGSLMYTEEQVQWLRLIKDYIANSFHVEKDDFEYNPVDAVGGLGKFYQLFKDDSESILSELNSELVA